MLPTLGFACSFVFKSKLNRCSLLLFNVHDVTAQMERLARLESDYQRLAIHLAIIFIQSPAHDDIAFLLLARKNWILQ